MTVLEYIRKFEELSRFVTHMVGTNGLKVDRFLEGLRPELNKDVLMSGIQNMSFPEVTDKALLAEQAEVKIVRAQEVRSLNRNQNQKVFRVNKNWNENKKKWAGKRHGGKQNEPHLKRGRPDNQTEAKAPPS
ncbi:Uncharacterized protein Adt_14834 [Abeliophyllum distichum]|uniref:Retrotransposon gag domain-containing protein n=1 Tax=Abeliophyllum distichum TaxID=126358 RepID=A0ABD1U0S4_9LAMI